MQQERRCEATPRTKEELDLVIFLAVRDFVTKPLRIMWRVVNSPRRPVGVEFTDAFLADLSALAKAIGASCSQVLRQIAHQDPRRKPGATPEQPIEMVDISGGLAAIVSWFPGKTIAHRLTWRGAVLRDSIQRLQRLYETQQRATALGFLQPSFRGTIARQLDACGRAITLAERTLCIPRSQRLNLARVEIWDDRDNTNSIVALNGALWHLHKRILTLA